MSRSYRILIKPSTRIGSKFMALVPRPDDTTRTVHFGARGYDDYTTHKDPERMRRYVSRHRTREDWTGAGIETAGFWARWLLWSEPTLERARRRIERTHNVRITLVKR